MKKYLILLACIFTISIAKNLQAQEAFAGGEISAEYIGVPNPDCSDLLEYRIILKFFRDDPANNQLPLPPTKTVEIVDVTAGKLFRNLWTSQTVNLDGLNLTGRIPTPCIIGTPFLTDGGYYSNITPIILNPNSTYVIHYGNNTGNFNFTVGRDLQSPINRNIIAGQTFYMNTTINTRCETFITGPADTPPNEIVTVNHASNSTPIWRTNSEILKTICEGEPFTVNLYQEVYSPDNVNFLKSTQPGIVPKPVAQRSDSLEFKIKGVLRGEANKTLYVPGRGTFDPLPTDPNDPFVFDEKTGIMSFTAQLENGDRFYTSVMLIQVIERRLTYELVDLGNGNFDRRPVYPVVSVTNRQMRFIIADQALCNTYVPTISSSTFNAAEQAWQFNCAQQEMVFDMSVPMIFRTLDRSDFRMFRGNSPQSIDDNAYPIDNIYVDPQDIDQAGEFTRFSVQMYEPLGPGKYIMFLKTGDDGNTLQSSCGPFLEESDLIPVPIFINTNYQYTFLDDDNPNVLESQKNFCYPGNSPFNLDALKRQPGAIVNKADSFVFKYRGSSPTAPAQQTYFKVGRRKSRFDVLPTITIPDPYNFPTTPLTNLTDQFWTVGVGLNYDYTYNKVRYRARCYAEDATFVQYFEHPKVKAFDIDLCQDEDWPTITDLVDPQFKQYNPLGTFSPINYSWVWTKKGDQNIFKTVIFSVPVYDANGNYLNNRDSIVNRPYSVGRQSTATDLANGTLNDSYDVGEIAGSKNNDVYEIRSIVTFNNGCMDTNLIKVARRDIEVKIGNDSIICRGEQYELINTKTKTYLRPSLMSRQWFYGEDTPDQPLMGETSDTVLITKKGWYKLVVTKTTDNSMCFGEDSVFINIADTLLKTDPICSIVTSDKGTIKQRFYWPAQDGAEGYQVRGIDPDGNPLDSIGETPTPNGEVIWYRANDDFGIHHWISGKEVRLLVRAFNNEVDEGTPCKYGEVGLAEACEVIVRDVNIFTPNGDGINDFLEFDLLETFTGSKLQVFNRWGRLLFESSNYQNDWDGDNLKDGTYFYILDVDDPSGSQDIIKGNFTLVR